MKTKDWQSQLISRFAWRIHPRIGDYYDCHTQFFNDGFIELICLVIANVSIAFLSLYVVGWALALLCLVFVTPITFGIKYLSHKRWVWK